jgi:hypothetical protein
MHKQYTVTTRCTGTLHACSLPVDTPVPQIHNKTSYRQAPPSMSTASRLLQLTKDQTIDKAREAGGASTILALARKSNTKQSSMHPYRITTTHYMWGLQTCLLHWLLKYNTAMRVSSMCLGSPWRGYTTPARVPRGSCMGLPPG